MADYQIEIDEDEYPTFAGDIDQMFRMFLEDLDYEWCGNVLNGMADVDEGKVHVYYLNTNVISFIYDSIGARMTIAAKLKRNPSIHFTRSQIEEGLNMMRAGIEKVRAIVNRRGA